MIWENFKMALRAITGAKLRSFLTMLGIIIGISSVVSISAIGEGVKQSVKNQVAAFGTNILQVNPGKGFDPEGGGFNPTAAFGTSTLTEADLDVIRRLSDIEAVAPVAIVSGIVTAGGKTAPGGFIVATTPDYARAVKTELSQGTFNTVQNQAVLGYKMAQDLFGDAALGQKITIRGRQLTVVGIMQKPAGGSSFGPSASLDMAVYIPFDLAKDFSGGTAQINEIDAKVKSADRVKEAKRQVIDAVKASHGGQDDFSVLTAEEQLKVVDTILALLTSFIAAVASIALLVGGIGVMNIMLVSVTERTREIGIRKALGATRRMIMQQFLIEALVISLIGGLLGCLSAIAMSTLGGRLANITPGFTPNMFITAAGVSTLIGVVFGLAPAIKAARKRPIEALRYE